MVMDFVERNLDDLIKRWARKIEYDVCFLCPTCSKKTLLKHSFKWKSLKCGEHTIRTAAVKSRFGMSEEGVETGNKSPMMPKRSKQLQDASSSQTVQTSHPSTGETLDTSQLLMKEILTDIFLLTLSQKINLVNVPAVNFSLYLGFSAADGTAAAVAANVALNPQSAFNTLLSKFVMTNGRKSNSALNLRKRFLDNEMKDCADVIKAELEGFGILVPSGEETLVDTPVFIPSSTGGTPDGIL
ncbi:uncharacterized protein LOC100888214 [Strongylocentrotus purpuratus]|uniref:Uncharacterized protein n=1 Tax=Strongylocentrotus purpuratus TaxID=7668 RepID=A0A7M7NF56_STRPU|nr:uncharacterized protein LOC100888214 [Strongylocentrotus purpuratus]